MAAYLQCAGQKSREDLKEMIQSKHEGLDNMLKCARSLKKKKKWRQEWTRLHKPRFDAVIANARVAHEKALKKVEEAKEYLRRATEEHDTCVTKAHSPSTL